MAILLTPRAGTAGAIERSPLRLVAGKNLAAQAAASVGSLEVGKPVERELARDEVHTYHLTFASGQYVDLTFSRRGIDLIATVFGPDGNKIAEANSKGRLDQTVILFVTERAGSYRLEVRSAEKDAPTGRYEVKIEELRPATPRDKALIEAEKAAAEGILLYYQQTAESLRKAIEKYQEALDLWRSVGERTYEAVALNAIGGFYSLLRENQKALDYYNLALAIWRAVGDSRGEAEALNMMGQIYGYLGEDRKALGYFNRALPLRRATGDRLGEGKTLNNIGLMYSRLGQKQRALEFYTRSVDIDKSLQDRRGAGSGLANIGAIYSELGHYQKALDYFNQALALARAVGDRVGEAIRLGHIGRVHSSLGENQKALHFYNQALSLQRAIGDPQREATTRYDIARLERDRGNLLEARQHIEAALALVESVRSNVASAQLRAVFFASVRKYHELNIDLLMRLHKERPSEGYDAAALQASEKGRARSLLELLAEASAEIRQGVDSPLIERERALRRMISDKAERQVRLLSGNYTAAQAGAAANELDELTAEYEQLLAHIRQSSPRYAALTQPATLSTKEIQTAVLDDETMLLEYALGEGQSFLWVVTRASISSFELPGRAEIEAAARRLYRALTARNQVVPREAPAQRRRRLERADAEYPKAAAELSRIVLRPATSELQKKRLLIVAEGMLQYVPFAALPAPVEKDEGGRMNAEGGSGSTPSFVPHPSSFASRPLIADHEIVTSPSASVLAVLRRETGARRASDKKLAVFADPVFDNGDPRVYSPANRQAAIKETALPGDIRGSGAESGLQDFVRLRFSRQEADQIAALVSEGDNLKALDFRANRATATSPELNRYAILHFATHGLINNEHPELSGVVLSLVNEQGRPQDGFLRLYDIYNLKLGADLVVLSACQTALGKEIKGEGLIGLTRGFMYAGAPRVVASLWQIDDRVTAEFMRRFYEAMFVQGLRPAAALRAAQVSMSKDNRRGAPHYWAAFTLQGEWN